MKIVDFSRQNYQSSEEIELNVDLVLRLAFSVCCLQTNTHFWLWQFTMVVCVNRISCAELTCDVITVQWMVKRMRVTRDVWQIVDWSTRMGIQLSQNEMFEPIIGRIRIHWSEGRDGNKTTLEFRHGNSWSINWQIFFIHFFPTFNKFYEK